jgi:hypothetical protein
MMKKHVRERRFNFLQWIADRGRPFRMDAMSTLPWLAIDDPNDDCESLDDDVLGRRAQAASEALFEEIRALPDDAVALGPEDDDIEIDDMILQKIQ